MPKLFKVKASLFLLIGLIILCGCADNHVNKSARNGHQSNQGKEIKKDHRETKKISLSKIFTNETSKKNRQTPINTVIHEIEWELSTGKKVSPSKNDVLLDSTLGNQSVVAVKVPNTAIPWWNVIFLSYSDHQQWVIKSVVEAPIRKLNDDVKGLNIPMKKYTVINDNLGEKPTWVFADREHVIVICKYPEYSFSPPKGTKAIHLKGHEAFIHTQNKQSTLYYFDSEKLVWISGNMSETKIRDLAASLPSATSADFPNRR